MSFKNCPIWIIQKLKFFLFAYLSYFILLFYFLIFEEMDPSAFSEWELTFFFHLFI